MRHNKKHGMKLGTDASHTKAMKRSLTCALLANDRIKTLEPRAKAIRPPNATAETVKPVAEPEPGAVEDSKDDAAEAAKEDEPAEDSVEDDTPAEETPTE